MLTYFLAFVTERVLMTKQSAARFMLAGCCAHHVAGTISANTGRRKKLWRLGRPVTN